MSTYKRLEDLIVYKKLCQLHLPEQDRRWPQSVREGGEQYGDRIAGFPEPLGP